LIGANGKGKSTLLRIIAGTEPCSGERKWGHNVDESFYAQHQLEALNINNAIIDEMKECGSQMSELELRGLLGCFLFSGDDADKKIKILSGGEKARVALAKVIVSKANFLMLDEPTNHLDMHSCDLLIEALDKYEGSIILVSHDRYFVSKTANKIWEIVDHQIKEFKGGYEEWVAWKERMARQEQENKKLEGRNQKSEVRGQKSEVRGQKQDTTTQRSDKTQGGAGKNKNTESIRAHDSKPPSSLPINKEAKKELQKMQRQFQQVEEKLAALQLKKVTLEAALVDPAIYSDKNKFTEAETTYKKAQEETEQLNKEYERLFEKIMELDK
ncbi:MAG: ATP-binding cassette domain-containing protein, partial [Chitinophagaceae bacterium]